MTDLPTEWASDSPHAGESAGGLRTHSLRTGHRAHSAATAPSVRHTSRALFPREPPFSGHRLDGRDPGPALAG